jgi:hypothetical protein
MYQKLQICPNDWDITIETGAAHQRNEPGRWVDRLGSLDGFKISFRLPMARSEKNVPLVN